MELLASIRSIDNNVKRLVQHIESLGEERDTIFLFQSDNGGATHIGQYRNNFGKPARRGCNYPYKGTKTRLTEGGTLAPSFAYSIKSTIIKKFDDSLFHISDWFPTILSFANGENIELVNRLDGVNQKEIFTTTEQIKQKRKNLVYGIVSRYKNGRWFDFTAFRLGDYKFYNFVPKIETYRCPEGFKNTWLTEMLRERIGRQGSDSLWDNLRRKSTDQWSKNEDDTRQMAIYNLKKDPFELNDLVRGRSIDDVLRNINAELKAKLNPWAKTPFVEKGLKNVLEREKGKGFQLPVTGKNAKAWSSFLSSAGRELGTKFLEESGRMFLMSAAQSEVKDIRILGSNFCKTEKDPKFMQSIIKSHHRNNNLMNNMWLITENYKKIWGRDWKTQNYT